MLFFADTADTKALKHLNDMGLLDGVTTNPSLIAKTGKELAPLFEEILALIKGPVSLEVTAMDTEGMLKEAKHLSSLGSNVVIKLPLTLPGLAACRNLSEKGIQTNVTLCFSLQQALMAAKAGATFVSPFVGRLDDICQDGMELIEEIRMVYDNYDYETKILVASVRNLAHIRSSILIGADAITCPPNMFESMAKHPLTDKGLEAFLSDWKKSGKKI